MSLHHKTNSVKERHTVWHSVSAKKYHVFLQTTENKTEAITYRWRGFQLRHVIHVLSPWIPGRLWPNLRPICWPLTGSHTQIYTQHSHSLVTTRMHARTHTHTQLFYRNHATSTNKYLHNFVYATPYTTIFHSPLAICRPSDCTLVPGVVVSICNRSQMRTSKCNVNFWCEYRSWP